VRAGEEVGFYEAIGDGVIGFCIPVGAAAEPGRFFGDGIFDIMRREEVGGVAARAGAVGIRTQGVIPVGDLP